MTVYRPECHIDHYRELARIGDVSSLSGRPKADHVTQYISRRIIEDMNVTGAQSVLDIGCGDGTLLSLLQSTQVTRTGTVPTQEEHDLLSNNLPDDIDIKVAEISRLPFSDSAFSRVICNGVLVLLPQDQIDSALKEIFRVAKKGALIYIGAIPNRDESLDKPFGDSLIKWVVHQTTKHGLREGYRCFKKVVTALFGRESLFINPKTVYFEAENEFSQRLKRLGFQVVKSEVHQVIDAERNTKTVASRNNYLCCKP